MDAYSFLYKTIILYSHCCIKDQFLNVKVDKSCYYKVSKDFFDTGIEPILDDIYDLLVSHMENTDILKNDNLEYFYDLINEFFLEY